MEKCKFCQTDLEENNTICPNCGKDNAQDSAAEVGNEAISTAETAAPAAEEKKPEGILLTPGKIAVLAVVFIVLVAVIVGLIVAGAKKTVPVEEPTETVEETAAPTVPEGSGDAKDAACKGTYTADDETVKAAANNIVAKTGNMELTNEQLQVFYWMEVRQFLSNYGGYAAYFGLDVNQDLDKQVCGMAENRTWQQYFLEHAIESWGSYSAMTAEGEAAGNVLDPEFQKILDDIPTDLQAGAEANQLNSVDEMLKITMGAGATQEAYTNFLNLYYKGYDYYGKKMASFQPGDKEIEAYFDGHEGDFADNGISKDTCTVDVRHILLFPEGATSETIRTEEFPEEAWAASEANANDILNSWLTGEKTEDSFAVLANEKSQDAGSNTNGGLYTGVNEGEMVLAFNDWCFDPARQVGDTDVVRTEYGFHIMYFCGRQIVWQDAAKQALLNELSENFANEIMDRYPITADYSQIAIGTVDMMGNGNS